MTPTSRVLVRFITVLSVLAFFPATLVAQDQSEEDAAAEGLLEEVLVTGTRRAFLRIEEITIETLVLRCLESRCRLGVESLLAFQR